jgi:hypothetical protein
MSLSNSIESIAPAVHLPLMEFLHHPGRRISPGQSCDIHIVLVDVTSVASGAM